MSARPSYATLTLRFNRYHRHRVATEPDQSASLGLLLSGGAALRRYHLRGGAARLRGGGRRRRLGALPLRLGAHSPDLRLRGMAAPLALLQLGLEPAEPSPRPSRVGARLLVRACELCVRVRQQVRLLARGQQRLARAAPVRRLAREGGVLMQSYARMTSTSARPSARPAPSKTGACRVSSMAQTPSASPLLAGAPNLWPKNPQAASEAESARRISSWTRPARESVAGCARIRGPAASPTAADDVAATRRVLAPLRRDARGDVAQGADMV